MVDSRFYERSPMRRLITLMMVVVVCVGVVVSPRVPSAGAAECKGTVSDLQWKPNSTIQNGIFVGNYGEGADVQFNWKVDSDANPGDQFTLKVPDELVRLGRKDLSLYSSDGEEVAKGTWNEGTKTWTFTLTDYARTHGDISGTAFFSVQWDRTKLPRTLPTPCTSQDAKEVGLSTGRHLKKASVDLNKQHGRPAFMIL